MHAAANAGECKKGEKQTTYVIWNTKAYSQPLKVNEIQVSIYITNQQSMSYTFFFSLCLIFEKYTTQQLITHGIFKNKRIFLVTIVGYGG